MRKTNLDKIKYTINFFILSVIFFSCKENYDKKYKYTFLYGGINGGWYKTNEYIIKNGYYLFLSGKDSIKIKENLINVIEKHY
jgi:hypothetical protein